MRKEAKPNRTDKPHGQPKILFRFTPQNFGRVPGTVAGYLRYYEIPRILSWNAGMGAVVEHDGAKLLELCGGDRHDQVGRLFEILDAVLAANSIRAEDLGDAVELFNEAFEETNPAVQILAWGENIADILEDPWFEDEIETDADEDENAAKLKGLLADDKFDLQNEDHVELAIEYIESECHY